MIPVEAAAAVGVIADTSITINRTTGSYVNGLWVSGTPTTTQITASVQPAVGNDLLRLPEGQRNRETLKVISLGEMRTADPTLDQQADTFDLYGRTYQVEQVLPWGGAFYEALAQRTGD